MKIYENKDLKIKHVFKPVMKTLLGFLIIYSIFHWVFLEYFYSFDIAEEYLIYKMPIFIIALLYLFVFLPRMNLDKFKKLKDEEIKFPKYLKILNIINIIGNSKSFQESQYKRGKWAGIMLIIMLMIFSTTHLQIYINKKISKVTELNSFSEVDLYPKTKYYKVKNYFLDFHCSPYFENTGSVIDYEKYQLGKNYFVNAGSPIFPIYNNSKDTLNRNSYLGWIFNSDLSEFYNVVLKSMQNNTKYNEDKYFLDFYNKPTPIKKVNKEQYFIRVHESSNDFEFYYDLIKFYDNYPNNKKLFIFKNTTFEARTDDNLFWFIFLFIIVLLLISLIVFSQNLDLDKIERLENGESVLKINIPPFLLKLLAIYNIKLK